MPCSAPPPASPRYGRLRLAGAVLLFGLALGATHARADPQALVLHEDFEGSDFSAQGGLFYKNNREQGAGSHVFSTATARTGRQSIDLSVRPQCATPNGLCSERAEVWERPEVLVPYGAPVWYGFSMKMAEPIPTMRHRYVMAQWKREIEPGADGDYSPLLALRLIEGKLAVTVDTDTGSFVAAGAPERPGGCRTGEAAAGPPDDFNQFRALIAVEPGSAAGALAGFSGCTPDLVVQPRGGKLPALDSGWIDFAFLVQAGPEGNGRIEILANGQWIASVTGRIGHEGPGLGENMYFKFGPYRAGAADVWRIYYDNFRRGPTCTDVAPAATCGKLTPPVEASTLTP
ncbi:polysaccharide lyase [Ancylobacter sp. A5.8]|uniref:polysaccharide lyase n=1 Tax=Ancylobacter gelatini TaxID=2919920 RepID=UPI001F4E8ADE|nr:polysaccharide lyase [Ancylobacter gelatini]MCJ8142508.1 polysaccharide lyase [Ancylobacter gelatini]